MKKRLAHFSAMLLIICFALGITAFAAKAPEVNESSALIDLQLQNISEDRGRAAAQEMLILALDTLAAPSALADGQMTAVVPSMVNKARQEATPLVSYSFASLIAFSATAVFLMLLLFFVVWRKKRSAKTPSPAGIREESSSENKRFFIE